MVRLERNLEDSSDSQDLDAFGMWSDREDMRDVDAWLSNLRNPRYVR